MSYKSLYAGGREATQRHQDKRQAEVTDRQFPIYRVQRHRQGIRGTVEKIFTGKDRSV